MKYVASTVLQVSDIQVLKLGADITPGETDMMLFVKKHNEAPSPTLACSALSLDRLMPFVDLQVIYVAPSQSDLGDFCPVPLPNAGPPPQGEILHSFFHRSVLQISDTRVLTLGADLTPGEADMMLFVKKHVPTRKSLFLRSVYRWIVPLARP
ncbi:hypothetical protein BJ138DRAFT_1125499 [Hygrophoropsis aurantiaca]|uniref:Uncharacterized protein n=1 Tax=Hygrophoropsis aurantiaca TaxID=72124 RepID=A0ACB8AGM1_9AGAM|nr:hypothetical protein BJ138DRAFT_1125499 [Hygrophoropsis aurantiaca]